MEHDYDKDCPESVRLMYKDWMHPQIYRAYTIPFEQRIELQCILELQHNGDFLSLMKSIMEYCVLPDIEEYEKAAEVRDWLNGPEAAEYKKAGEIEWSFSKMYNWLREK